MFNNIQSNVPDAKIVPSQENTSSRLVENRKSHGEYIKSVDDSLRNVNKSSTIMVKNTKRISKKNMLQQKPVRSASLSDSRSKLSADSLVINQNINSTANVKFQKKLLIGSTSVPEKANDNLEKNKLKKQISNGNKESSFNIIHVAKNSSHTAKERTKSIRKNENKATVKDKGHGISNSNSINASQERKKSRTLSPSEIKILRTNIKSPEICSGNSSLDKASNQHSSSIDCDYEDDFENYESDFQECTDSDEEAELQMCDELEATANETEVVPIELQTQRIEMKIVSNIPRKKYIEHEHMLDSGHYELHEARQRAARIDLMTANQNARAIVPTMERSMLYFAGKPSDIKSLPSSADEGFEDGRSGDFVKLSPIFHKFNEKNSTYRDESSHEKQIKLAKRRLTRGEQLLEMIRLDAVGWSLYESTPVAYDEFIRIHGKINTRQISTQTNDDNLSVEVQTEKITYKNMWTQFPTTCRTVLENNDDINLFMAELAGVGSDVINIKPRPQYDILELNEFVGAAGNIILTLLESKQLQNTNIITDRTDIQQLPFGEATIKLSTANVTFLSDRRITMIRYSDISSEILLTIHSRVDKQIERLVNNDIYIADCCIGCQWNIFHASRPIKLFYSSYNITACSFHPTNYNIVFGGLEDGSLSLWDLGENDFYHRHVIDKENKISWTLRCVTFNSGGDFDEQTQSKIVSLKILSKIQANTAENVKEFMPLQLCSLDEEGNCIVWSVLRNFEGSSTINQDLGQSWWGTLRLIKSHEIPIDFNKRIDIQYFMGDFRDICVDPIDSNSLYIATNINHIFHVTNYGAKPNPSAFNGINSIGGTTCIEICPFGQPFFLVGCEDGTVRLHSSKIKNPLLQLQNSNSGASIKIIQWSKSKPFTIYILDDDANIHVWDLKYSSNFPVCSVTPNTYARVISMQLSPCRTDNEMKNQYMAIGFDNGTVEVHKFNRKFYNSRRDDLSSQLKTFLNYFDID